MWADRVLTKKEVFYFFLVASMFYVFPIIHADFRYIDDNWRSLLLDYDQWRDQGRMLLEYTLTGLSLVPAKVNMFPLPLFVSIGMV